MTKKETSETENVVFMQNLVEFHHEIAALKETGMNTIEAIAAYCEERDLEPEEILELINQRQFADIKTEAKKLNLLKSNEKMNAIEIMMEEGDE